MADNPPISARCLELLAANQRAGRCTRADVLLRLLYFIYLGLLNRIHSCSTVAHVSTGLAKIIMSRLRSMFSCALLSDKHPAAYIAAKMKGSRVCIIMPLLEYTT